MKNKSKIIISSAIIAAVILLITLIYRSHNPKRMIYRDMDTVCFERDIFPIFRSNCGVMGCHDQESASGKYVCTDYNSIIKRVVPFNPDKSKVYNSIVGKSASLMPPGKALRENERILIRVWIGQGAENTTCTVSRSSPEKNHD